jgi:hypothetical protein
MSGKLRAMAIWVIKDGQREGPYDEEDVRELIYEGTYTDNDPAIRDGQYDWSTIGDVLEQMPSDLPPVAEGLPDYHFPGEAPAPEVPPADLQPTPSAELAPPASSPPPFAPPPPMRVTVTDIDISFGSMVMLLLKWAAASFLVLMIVSVVLGVLWAILAVMAAAILH